ncbi:MAG: hypothetical protein ACREMA_06990, partial [Longimicrobiales bacterium]
QFPRNIGDIEWGPGVRITPYLGVSPGFSSGGPAVISRNGSTVAVLDDFDFAFDGGPVAGLNIEVRVCGRHSIVGALAVTTRGETVFDDADIFDEDRFVAGGGNLFMAKLVGQIRFRQEHPRRHIWRVNSALFLGPALVRDDPEDDLLGSDDDSSTHFAINFGAEGELPLGGRHWSITAAFEDYVMFWDGDALERRLLVRARREFGPAALVSSDNGISNLFVFRFGVAYRFGEVMRPEGVSHH